MRIFCRKNIVLFYLNKLVKNKLCKNTKIHTQEVKTKNFFENVNQKRIFFS